MKNSTKRNLVLLASLLSGLLMAGPLGAQESLVMDLESAVERALEVNLGLASEALNLDIRRRARDTVWNRFLPQLTVGAGLNRLNSSITASGLAPVSSSFNPGTGTFDEVRAFSQEVDPTWNLGLSLNAQLALTPALFRGIQQTLIDYDNGNLALEQARRRLERDVRKAFYQILSVQEALELTERQIQAAQRRWEDAQANFELGLIPELSVLSARVNYENRRPALDEQRIGLEGALLSFKNLLGLDLDTDLVLEGAIPSESVSADAEALVRNFLERRLDLQVLEGQVRSLDNVESLQRDALLPTLVFMFSMDPSLADVFNGDSWESESAWNQRSGMFAIQLSWRLDSLIPGSTAQVELSNLRDQREQIRLAYQQARSGAATEVRLLVSRLEKSMRSMDTLELNVDLARRAYALSQEAYEAGSQSLLEVQEAEIQLQAAQFQVLSEKLSLNNTLLDLEYALNTPRDQWNRAE